MTSTPIFLLDSKGLTAWKKTASTFAKGVVETQKFTAAEHTSCVIADVKTGKPAMVLCGVGEVLNRWSMAHLPAVLPAGEYALQSLPKSAPMTDMVLGWELACYSFSEFKKDSKTYPTMEIPAGVDNKRLDAQKEAVVLARNLINLPANHLGPNDLANHAKALAAEHKAKCSVIVGEDLLKKNYPTIYTVGAAGHQPPQLIDIRWGNPKHEKITLVGKGVCFDTGGLNIKTGNYMALMKKDMGGAAHVLALAHIIMALKLPVCLRVLVPAVENSISDEAMRPSDVVKTRKGITVEIGDTDAEGRLILCDALAEADSEKPALIIDCATLTGAARVALGAEIPAFFTPDDSLAKTIDAASAKQSDPLWRLPLWEPYREQLKSHVADTNNISSGGYGGAITAALYLKSFVEHTKAWVHVDMMAWNVRTRPGRPIGGDVQGLFALLDVVEGRSRKAKR